MSRLNILGALAGGILIGGAIGLLMAPQSGAKTRGYLRKRGSDMTDYVMESVNTWKSKLSHYTDNMKFNDASIKSLFSEIANTFRSKNVSFDVNALIAEGKNSWYKLQHDLKEGQDLTASQVDDMLNHIFTNAESIFNNLKENVGEMVSDAEDTTSDMAVDAKTSFKNVKNEIEGAYQKMVS